MMLLRPRHLVLHHLSRVCVCVIIAVEVDMHRSKFVITPELLFFLSVLIMRALLGVLCEGGRALHPGGH